MRHSRLAVLIGVLLLPGCLSPAATAVSWGADGASYAASGKTIGDHALSAALVRDCGIFRIVRDKPICVDLPPSDVPVEDRRRREYLVVVGSFVERGNADRAATQYARYGVTVVLVTVDGRGFNRVVVGPVSTAELHAIQVASWRAPR
jgi:hypothetical protein